MLIPVAGLDPSLRFLGIAEGLLDLGQGFLTGVRLTLVQTRDLEGKQVRRNSSDLHVAQQLAEAAFLAARRAKVVFVEVPVGSQSSRAMASYGICVGVLGALRAEGIPLIEVTAAEVKLAFTGNENATKREMIAAAVSYYPDASFPLHQGKVAAKAEHLADALASIHAGVNTPLFQTIMRLTAKEQVHADHHRAG